MIFTLLLFVFVCFAFVVQDFIPTIPWAYYAQPNLVVAAFFACAISVPYPVMLLLAFFTGFIYDFKNGIVMYQPELQQAVENLGKGVLPKTETTLGFSIFLFGLLGSLMQGIRPLFRKGRWEMPVIMSGVGAFLFYLLEYLWINFRRGGFWFPQETWYSILTSALLSMLAAPLIFFLIAKLARICDYHIRYEGLTKRWQS